MKPIFYVNIALELFGAAISFIIIICSAFREYEKSKLDKIFIMLLAGNTLVLLSDAVAILLKGNPATLVSIFIRVANFCVFSFGYIFLAIFTEYLVLYIERKAKISKRIVYIIWTLCAIAVFMVVISQFNHMFYDFDKNNVYIRGDWFWMSQIFGIVSMLINATIIVKYRKVFTRQEFVFFMIYVILPIMAMIIQIKVYGLALLYIATTFSVLIIYIGVQSDQARQLKQKEAELTESNIKLMLSQIQPHFLYNSLSAIDRLCYDNKQAHEAIIAFSRYLRANMDSLTQKDMIFFSKELEHTKHYLWLEQLRFEDNLEVVYDLKVQDFMLPVLTLQPIVENAVRHGIIRKKFGGTITIKTQEKDNAYVITVSDDGKGFDTEKIKSDGKNHVGIFNVRERIAAVCNGRLEIESLPDKGTIVTITIPKEF